jgi:hypothetical protein
VKHGSIAEDGCQAEKQEGIEDGHDSKLRKRPVKQASCDISSGDSKESLPSK